MGSHLAKTIEELPERFNAASDLLYYNLAAGRGQKAAVIDRDGAPVIAVQLEYNIAARTPERELLPMADALDLGMVCWGPAAAGALSDGVGRRRMKKTPAHIAVAAEKVCALAEQSGVDVHALALRWVMAQGRCVPVVGARDAMQIEASLAMPVIEPSVLREASLIAPPDLGFPHDLIQSPYLRRFALGDPEALAPPLRPRC